MASYVSSGNNRFYVALEQGFGNAGSITANQRIAATSLQVREDVVYPERRDKTGSRTQSHVSGPLRKSVQYALRSYFASSGDPENPPAYGALIEAAMGGPVRSFGSGTVDSIPAAGQVRLTAAHSLGIGQAVTFGSEIRFVTSIVDSHTVALNAPFTVTPSAGTPLGGAFSYGLARELKSVSLFDYWDPDSAVQRLIAGGIVDRLKIGINGDFHELEFRGPASQVVDSVSFTAGAAQLSQFPLEPALAAAYMSTPVPGHLGQAWLGAVPTQFFTITKATVEIDNQVDLRTMEFGRLLPSAVVPGTRIVRFECSLFERDDIATKALYQAARQRSGIQVMLQLGQQQGQLMGVFLKSVVPEIPQFDDRESRLQWRFEGCLARGQADDEMYLAFG